jgi:hypothetical protein
MRNLLSDKVLNGAGTTNRTRDLLITSQLLYQLSYTGIRSQIRLMWPKTRRDFSGFDSSYQVLITGLAFII